MKKIFTLLTLLVATITAMASTTQYKGTWHFGDSSASDYEGSVSVTDNGDNTYTLAFDGLEAGSNSSFGAWTMENLSGTEADGVVTIPVNQIQLSLPNSNVAGQVGYLSNGTITVSATDFSLSVKYLDYGYYSSSNVTFTATKVEGGDEQPKSVTYSNKLQVSFLGETMEAYDADIVMTPATDGTYSLNLPNFKVGDAPVGGLTLTGVTVTDNEDGTKAVAAAKQDVAIETDDVEYMGVSASVSFDGTIYGDSLAGTFNIDIADIGATGIVAKYGVEDDTVMETVIVENYVADGTGFIFTTPIDWETQKVQAVIDLSTCQRSVEDVLSIGATPTNWNNNIHMYRDNGYIKAYFDAGSGNNSTGNLTVDDEITVELSKTNGLTLNDSTIIAAENLSDIFALSEISIGSGEGSDQQSYATYKSIKLVPTEAEVVEIESKEFTLPLYTTDQDDNEQTQENKTVEYTRYSDGNNTLKLVDFNTDNVKLGDLEFTGLSITEYEGITYIFNNRACSAVVNCADSEWDGKSINGYFNGTIIDGNLYLEFDLASDSDESLAITGHYGDEAKDVYTVSGTLIATTVDGDGVPSSASSASTMTLVDNNDGTFDVSFTNAEMPGTTISLGTIAISGVEGGIGDDGSGLALKAGSKSEGVTTEASHPAYTTLDMTSFDGAFTGESAWATLVVDNYGETVYFKFNGGTVGIGSLNTTEALGKATVFGIDGTRRSTMQHGINILRTNGGKTVKVNVK